MKIAIPLDENRLDVCPVLARTPYFCFRMGEQEEVLENPAAQAEGGAGAQAAQFLVDMGTTVLLTPRCGENAAQVFAAAGIEIFKTAHKTAVDNFAAYEEGKLEKLTRFHGGYHGIL